MLRFWQRLIPVQYPLKMMLLWFADLMNVTEEVSIRRYHQRLCLEAWHINSAHAPLNRDDGGLLPDAYLHLVRRS